MRRKVLIREAVIEDCGNIHRFFIGQVGSETALRLLCFAHDEGRRKVARVTPADDSVFSC